MSKEPLGDDLVQGCQVLMSIGEDGKTVWFSLYEKDALGLRRLLVPGTAVALFGFVSTYEASGGYNPDAHNPTLDEEKDLRIRDRIQLDVSSLVLVIVEEALVVAEETLVVVEEKQEKN